MSDHRQPTSNALLVYTRDGFLGTLEPSEGQPQTMATIITRPDGGKVVVERSSLIRRDDGALTLPLSSRDAGGRTDAVSLENGQAVTVPVVEEVATIEKRQRAGATVVVHVTPGERQEAVDVPLIEQRVEIQRVPLEKLVSEMPGIRQEGDVTVVPVVEEVVVLEKRLLLKEEIRITRRKVTSHGGRRGEASNYHGLFSRHIRTKVSRDDQA